MIERPRGCSGFRLQSALLPGTKARPHHPVVEITRKGIPVHRSLSCRRRLRLRNRSYDTSITQGGNASRPGCCYQAMLARDLNLDYANFGFAGKGRCEREIAEFLSEVEASCFVNTS